ncbi:hypothetical protein CPB85DRAFT_1314690 [Mucidula mucida]|nr:hypothetical protein CPB85DRAFT_1314690 [Mucidula mucida]
MLRREIPWNGGKTRDIGHCLGSRKRTRRVLVRSTHATTEPFRGRPFIYPFNSLFLTFTPNTKHPLHGSDIITLDPRLFIFPSAHLGDTDECLLCSVLYTIRAIRIFSWVPGYRYVQFRLMDEGLRVCRRAMRLMLFTLSKIKVTASFNLSSYVVASEVQSYNCCVVIAGHRYVHVMLATSNRNREVMR